MMFGLSLHLPTFLKVPNLPASAGSSLALQVFAEEQLFLEDSLPVVEHDMVALELAQAWVLGFDLET